MTGTCNLGNQVLPPQAAPPSHALLAAHGSILPAALGPPRPPSGRRMPARTSQLFAEHVVCAPSGAGSEQNGSGRRPPRTPTGDREQGDAGQGQKGHTQWFRGMEDALRKTGCRFPTQTPRNPTSGSKIYHPQRRRVSVIHPVFTAHLLCAYWSHGDFLKGHTIKDTSVNDSVFAGAV